MLTKALELAAQITHPITAAIFAAVLALIALLSLSRRRTKTPAIAWMLSCFIFILGLLPLAANFLLEDRGIYRVRIEVLDPNNQPVHDASITSSAGGELKKTDAGWEFTIPPQSRPSDNRVTFRASEPSTFLAGSTTLELARDYFPISTLRLAALAAATTRGIVVDSRGQPITGARVWILGYDDTVTTSSTGSFSLPSHAAEGQQVILMAQLGRYTSQTSGFAGRTTEIVLHR